MKQSNRKKIVSLVLCGAFLAGSLMIPAEANAATKTITGTGKKTNGSATVDTTSGTLDTATIPIRAKTGGSDIIYDIVVEYGDMNFSYSYGRTWDPTNHVYSSGTAGWNPDDLDGNNNKITVTNNSNYPIKASFTIDDPDALAAKFNENTGVSSAVHGSFSTSLSTFIASGTVTSAVNDGSAPSSVSPMTLQMDSSKLTTGDVYYKKGNTTATSGEMYFALSGVPDKSIDTLTPVGNIVVTIEPESDTTRVTV